MTLPKTLKILQEQEQTLLTLMNNLPGMAYRCHNDPGWTMEFVSKGSFSLTGYQPADLIGNQTIAYEQLMHPDDRASVWEDVQLALKEKRPFQLAYRITTAAGEEKWVWEKGRGVFSANGELLALEGFITDITERVLNRQELEKRVEARTHELTTLFDVQQAITSRLDPDAVMQLIADEARRLTSSQRAIVFLLEGDVFRIVADTDKESAETLLGYRIPAEGSLAQLAIQTQKPVYVADVRNDPHVKFDPRRRNLVEQTGAQSLMAVPLISDSHPLGVISILNKVSGTFGSTDERVLMMLASSAVIGLENARLYWQEQSRQRQLQTLLDVSAAASSSLDLDEMLNTTLDRLVGLVGAARASVMLLGDDSNELELRATYPDRAIPAQELAHLTQAGLEVIAGNKPLYEPPETEQPDTQPAALLPLRARGQALGILAIIGQQSSTFNNRQLALFKSIAAQLGVAVDNTRLYEQAEKTAVAAERSRLARDLHDAVTQTLFSASLIAEVLPDLWEVDQIEGRQLLKELRQLSRGALAEMRTLLLERRPAALVEANMSDLLHQLAEAVTGRTGIPVTVTVNGKYTLPPDVHIALYHIAQEALNNVAKHARAGQSAVSLRCVPANIAKTGQEQVELSISDDGRGFDRTSVTPDRLGLGIMRERAEAIGATLKIESRPGHGTQVQAVWKK